MNKLARRAIDYLLNDETIVSRGLLPVLTAFSIVLAIVAWGWFAPGAPAAPDSGQINRISLRDYPPAVAPDILNPFIPPPTPPATPGPGSSQRKNRTKPTAPVVVESQADTIRNELIGQNFDDKALALFDGAGWARENLCAISRHRQPEYWGKYAAQARYLVASGKGGCGILERQTARSWLTWRLGGLIGWPLLLLIGALPVGMVALTVWVLRTKKRYHWLYRSKVYRPQGYR